MTQTQTAQNQLPGVVIGALADAFDKSFMTIQRWIKNNDIILTTDIGQKIFNEYGIEWAKEEG